MRVAITGATGFLGRRAAVLLSEKGYQVTSIGRKAGADLPRYRFAPLDNLGALERAFVGQDRVVHCAALSTPWGEKAQFFETNVVGTKNVVNACLKAKVPRLIHISTPSIYVDHRHRFGIRESDPLPSEAINDYAWSKRIAEQLVDEASEKGLETVTLRPQGIFGPGDPHIFPRLIKVAGKGRFPRFGTQSTSIDMTYIDNVVGAIECALKVGHSALGRKYNVTDGTPIDQQSMLKELFARMNLYPKEVKIPFALAFRLAHFLELLHRSLRRPGEPLVTRYSVCVLARTRTLNIEAAKSDLGYRPTVTTQEGIERYLAWWKENQAV